MDSLKNPHIERIEAGVWSYMKKGASGLKNRVMLWPTQYQRMIVPSATQIAM